MRQNRSTAWSLDHKPNRAPLFDLTPLLRQNPPAWMAAVGAVYLVGRMIYRNSYVKDPGSRGLGFALTILPTAVLLLATLAGAVMAMLRG